MPGNVALVDVYISEPDDPTDWQVHRLRPVAEDGTVDLPESVFDERGIAHIGKVLLEPLATRPAGQPLYTFKVDIRGCQEYPGTSHQQYKYSLLMRGIKFESFAKS